MPHSSCPLLDPIARVPLWKDPLLANTAYQMTMTLNYDRADSDRMLKRKQVTNGLRRVDLTSGMA